MSSRLTQVHYLRSGVPRGVPRGLVVLAIALFSVLLQEIAAAAVEERWVREYFIPFSSHDEHGVDVEIDSQGNAVVTGYKNQHPATTVTIKYSPDGSEVWHRHTSGRAVAMAIDDDDNTFVISETRGVSTPSDYQISRITRSGSFWSKRQFTTGSHDYPRALATDSHGSVVVTGGSRPSGSFVDTVLTVKYDSTGALQWSKVFDVSEKPFGSVEILGLSIDEHDNITVLASVPSTVSLGRELIAIRYAADGTELGATRYGVRANAARLDAQGNVYVASGFTSFTTLKFAPDGTQLWSAEFDGNPTGNGRPLALELDPSGNVVVTGITQGTDVQEFSLSTVKYTGGGALAWSAVRYQPVSGFFKSFADMVVDAAGNVIVVGSSPNAHWGNDFYTIKRRADGSFAWRRDYTDLTFFSDDGANAVAVDSHGDVYVTGHTYSLGDFRLGQSFSQNVLTIRYSEHPVPVADAGATQSVQEGTLGVQLDGSGSSGAASYEWIQLSGSPVVLFPSNTAISPTFDAPFVQSNQWLTFRLTVENATGDSDSDTVSVSIIQWNTPPIADAGDGGTVKQGSGAILDGTNSYDPEGDPLTFLWTQIAGPPVMLAPSNTVASPVFTAPAAGNVLTFSLQVSDGHELSVPDTVTITVVENSAPVANAGGDQTVAEGTLVTLDGTQSRDPDGGDTLSFSWSGPVALSDPTSPAPSFVAPSVGPGGVILQFDLVVIDDDPFQRKASTDHVSIAVQNVNDPPNCGLARAVCTESAIRDQDSCMLWPPNHRMVATQITGLSDPENDPVTIHVTGVTQDEVVDGSGSNDGADAVIIQDGVLLRAERTGAPENGRVYVVSFTADDGQGGTCSGSIEASVPQNRNGVIVDDGQIYDSTLP